MNKITKFFIIGTLIVWLIFDLYLAAKDHDTISRVIMNSIDNYAVPIIGGTFFILGHLFWGQKSK